MRKILIVAQTEFANAVRSKAFIFSLLILPFIYAIMFLVQIYADKADVLPRKFAVVDHTGKLFQALKIAADMQNKAAVDAAGKPTSPAFIPTLYDDKGKSTEDTTLELSDKVRSGEYYAFIEIPADATEAKPDQPVTVQYFSASPNYRDLPAWLDVVLGATSRVFRYQDAGVNPMLARKIDRPLKLEKLGLSSRGVALAGSKNDGKPGSIIAAKEIDPLKATAVPLVLAFLVYIITMTQPQQLVSTVIEEKMSRISEMLLGSLSPFQLLMGKLVGNAAVAMLTTTIYIGAAYLAALKYGYADAVTPSLLATLILFLGMAIFLFGSMFIAVGAACNDLKDAQSLIMPVVLVALTPIFLVGAVMVNPASNISVVASLIPTATPMLMTMRMAMSPPPPAWQVLLSIVLTGLSTLACVWASAKIFRTALLMHGKPPSFREMTRWVLAR